MNKRRTTPENEWTVDRIIEYSITKNDGYLRARTMWQENRDTVRYHDMRKLANQIRSQKEVLYAGKRYEVIKLAANKTRLVPKD